MPVKPVSCQYCERAARLGLGAFEGMVCGLLIVRSCEGVVGSLDACKYHAEMLIDVSGDGCGRMSMPV